jgi:hypothetical protein
MALLSTSSVSQLQVAEMSQMNHAKPPTLLHLVAVCQVSHFVSNCEASNLESVELVDRVRASSLEIPLPCCWHVETVIRIISWAPIIDKTTGPVPIPSAIRQARYGIL